MVAHTHNPSTSLRQQDHKFDIRWGNIENAKPVCLKKQNKTKITPVQNSIQCFEYILCKCLVNKFLSVLTSTSFLLMYIE